MIILTFKSAKSDGIKDYSEKKYVISGHIKDKNTGEDLLGATIYIKELNGGTVTNLYGFYSIS